MKNKYKIVLIVLLLLASIGIIIGFMLAYFSDQATTDSSTINSSKFMVEGINLQVQEEQNGQMGEHIIEWDAGDVNLLTWNLTNQSDITVNTRHTLTVKWNKEANVPNCFVYLYPANMSKEDIIEDYKSGELKYAIAGGHLNDNESNHEFSYQFMGDMLSAVNDNSNFTEENYNSGDFSSTTDDTSTNSDFIAYQLLFAPDAPYLLQENSISINVITEVAQYLENENDLVWEKVYEENIH